MAVARPWATRGTEQHARGGGDLAGQGRGPEQRDADQEEPAAAEEVGHPAEGQREPGGAQRERGGDPLQVVQREPDVRADDR